MNLLLDAHVFCWHIAGPPFSRLPARIDELIRDDDNVVYLSVTSIWELALKNLKGKLPLPGEPYAFLTQARARHRILPLELDEETLRHLAVLPSIHADPFDRILICQAMQHSLTIVTADSLIRRYPVPTLFF
ncbi:MAG: type II toxin-antitoxin system VapC family toxin [Phycisphaerales bacterium]|nr:type II toxin-antitoxin system VapC family toxin [Phycisphaerales bacterium]